MKIHNMIEQAVEILHRGGLVGLPTETVYGLAADASNPEALAKIFAAKGRPIDHPLIVHIGDIHQLGHWAVDISDQAWTLARHFWPGPLTLILKKAPHVLDSVTGGQDSIGIRIPNHPIALALLAQFGNGIAAPSANRFGRISPTTAEAVREELGQSVDLVLEGGQCEVGVESTIIDMRGVVPRILRPGMISASEVEAVLHRSLLNSDQSIRVSGALESHYAPETKIILMNAVELDNFLRKNSGNERFAIIVRESFSLVSYFQHAHPAISFIVMPQFADAYAHDIYKVMREVDKERFAKMIIEQVPLLPEWDAVRDRLTRAAG